MSRTIKIIINFLLPCLAFGQKVEAKAVAVCLPKPVKIVYPPGMKPFDRHPHQYSSEEYEGLITVEVGAGKRFELNGKSGVRVSGVDPGKSHTIRYRVSGKIIQTLKVKFEDSNYDLVVDQKAYGGAFRTLPPKNKCPYSDTVALTE
jgi:hypothetical protein